MELNKFQWYMRVENEKAWHNVQNKLFSQGFEWVVSGRVFKDDYFKKGGSFLIHLGDKKLDSGTEGYAVNKDYKEIYTSDILTETKEINLTNLKLFIQKNNVTITDEENDVITITKEQLNEINKLI